MDICVRRQVWGAINFRTADVDVDDMGRKIGEIVMRDFAKAFAD